MTIKPPNILKTKYWLIAYLLFFFFASLPAQNQKEIDSLEIALLSANESDKTTILDKLSLLYQNISIEKSIEYDLQNLELNRKMGKTQNQSTILNNLAINYYQIGQYYESIQHFEEALEILEQLEDTTVIMKTLNNLGVITQTVGQYDKSLKYLERSLQFKQKYNDTLSIAKTLNNIGVIYMNMGKYKEAQVFFNQAFEYYTFLNDNARIADLYNNLGQLRHAEGRLDSALILYKKSLEIKQQIGNEQGAGNSLNNIGMVLADMKMYDEAIEYFNEAGAIREKIGDRFGLSSTLNNLANLYLLKNEFQKALALYNTSNDIAKENNLKGILERNYAGLSGLFEKMNNYSEALKYYKIAREIRDSIFSEDFNNRLADIEVQFKLKQREKETEILMQKNQIQELRLSLFSRQKTLLVIAIVLILFLSAAVILQIRNLNRKKINAQLLELNKELQKRVRERTAELEESNKMKDQFLSIIAHDLKTPFNSILGFSEILSSDINKIGDRQREELANLILISSKNLYRLLENLLEWARLQSGNFMLTHGIVNLNEIIYDSVKSSLINADKKEIEINFNPAGDYSASADKVTIETVVRNLLSNAIKFTQRGGKVEIEINDLKDNEKEYVRISIIDNGTGISKGNLVGIFNIDNKFKREGTESEPGTGLGLILCRELITKNNGTIWAESTPGKGSIFHFTLPK